MPESDGEHDVSSNDDYRPEPDEEVYDDLGRAVAGRFYSEVGAVQVMQRLFELWIEAQLEERRGLAEGEARFWVWVAAEDLERARTCMRPADILGDRREAPQAAADAADSVSEKKRLGSRLFGR